MDDDDGMMINFSSGGGGANPFANLLPKGGKQKQGANKKAMKKKPAASKPQAAQARPASAAGLKDPPATKKPRPAGPKPAGNAGSKPEPNQKAVSLDGEETEKPTGKRDIISSLFSHNPEIPKFLPSTAKKAAVKRTHAETENENETGNEGRDEEEERKTGEEGKKEVLSESSFKRLGLSERLCVCLESRMKLTNPTHIQKAAIPELIKGRDALIMSQTGSGKTLAYLLPLLHNLSTLPERFSRTDGPQAVILAPTRELALQIFAVLQTLVNACVWIVPGHVIGGEKKASEKARIRKGINVLVATPGRLVDHIMTTTTLHLAHVRWLVMDEADRLMDLGFERDLTIILNTLNGHHPKYLDKETNEGDKDEGEENEDEENEDEEDEKAEKRRQKEKQAKQQKDKQSKTGKQNQKPGKNSKAEKEPLEILPPKPVRDRFGGKSKWLTRQNVLVSATLASGVQKMANLSLKDPVKIRGNALDGEAEIPKSEEGGAAKKIKLDADGNPDAAATAGNPTETYKTPTRLVQSYVCVPSKLRLVTLAGFLRRECIDKTGRPKGKAIVFMMTCDVVDFHHTLFTSHTSAFNNAADTPTALFGSLPISKLHGEMEQKDRTRVFRDFCNSKYGVLFATDVAARGLDLPNVNWIVQFSVPQETADYVHRVGRTARIGAGGQALLFLIPSEIPYVQTLEQQGIGMQVSDMNDMLKPLVNYQAANQKRAHHAPKALQYKPHTIEDAATQVQLCFEEQLKTDSELGKLARKAFTSYVRGYATYPRALKSAMNIHALHQGHVAKSFAMRDAPTAIATAISGNPSKKSANKNERQPFAKGGTQGQKGKEMFEGKSWAVKGDKKGPGKGGSDKTDRDFKQNNKSQRGGTTVIGGKRVDSKKSQVPSLLGISREKYKMMPIGGL